MRRRLFAVPVLALLVGLALLVLAAASPPVAARRLTLTLGESRDFASARFWPVSVRLGPAPSAVDVVLSLRLAGGSLAGRRVTVEVCRTAACDSSEMVWSSGYDLTGTVSAGRVGSLEPRDAMHLGVRVFGGSGARPRLAVNASPCTAPLQRQLWRARRTGLPRQSNTLAGMENCSTRRPPYLPYALEVLGAGACMLIVSRRIAP